MPESRKEQTLRYFGNYLLLGEIATGGMGVVYRADQPSANRSVALKMIRAGRLATEAEVRRFRTEAEAAAGLNHPNIVKIYEIGEHQGQPFFSMELIEGENLAEYVSRPQKHLSSREAATVLVKVARAVHHAHQRGILHRDLKPPNILIDEAGEPHLTDFGLAKCLGADRGQTQTYAVLGTPSYMAPELAAGNARDATIASDVYSLGAILYELLTGRPPFRGESAMSILDQVQRFDPPRPRSLIRNLDQDLETICLKCLEREPARRYAGAEALAQDLERWLSGEPISARPVTAVERLLKWVRRHPLKAALIVTAVGCLTLAPVAAVQWRRAEAQRELTNRAALRGQLLEIEKHFDSGDTSRALRNLARLLRAQPDYLPAAERLVNALRQRVFLLPIAVATADTNTAPQQRLAVIDSNRRVQARRVDAVHVQLTDLVSEQPIRTIRNAHDQVIRHISFRPGSTDIATASGDTTAKLWRVDSEEPLLVLKHDKAVHSAEFSPDGRTIITASRDRTARLWDATTGRSLATVMMHSDSVNSARFSADGKLIVTACDDGKVRLWNSVTSVAASEPACLTNAVEDAWFSTDGRAVFARTEDGGVHAFRATSLLVFDPVTSQDSSRLLEPASIGIGPTRDSLLTRLSRKHADEITFLDLSADEVAVVSASLDKTARLWNAQTLEPITESPLVHDAAVNCARFSPDGRRIVTSTANRKLRVWDARTGLPLSDWILSPDPVAAVAFSANGRTVIASAGWRWDLAAFSVPPPAWLPDLAEAIASGDAAELKRVAKALARVPQGDLIAEWARELLADEIAPNEK